MDVKTLIQRCLFFFLPLLVQRPNFTARSLMFCAEGYRGTDHDPRQWGWSVVTLYTMHMRDDEDKSQRDSDRQPPRLPVLLGLHTETAARGGLGFPEAANINLLRSCR